ncbi:MAG: hypothetical protein WD738_04555 [Pirellulales bacterium]
MAERTPNDTAWTLRGTVAELRRGTFSGRIDVSRPDLGLRQVKLNGQELPGHLVAVQRQAEDSEWPLRVVDCYVRGDDLVASYKPTGDWPYSPQLYWSADPLDGADGVLGSLSLLMSVETHLLDTWPRITVSSQLACQELLQVNPEAGTTETLQPDQMIRPFTTPCCVLHRWGALPISYVEIMPTSDFLELTVRHDAGDAFRAEWQLFADFLEKGVIRRARLQTALLSRANDLQLALACCEAMDRRPLPLTT